MGILDLFQKKGGARGILAKGAALAGTAPTPVGDTSVSRPMAANAGLANASPQPSPGQAARTPPPSEPLGTPQASDLAKRMFGETESFTGDGPFLGRLLMLQTMLNARDRWGAKADTYAGTHAPVLPHQMDARQRQILSDIQSTVDTARFMHRFLPDFVGGATNFTMRRHSSATPPKFARKQDAFSLQGVAGPINNTYGKPSYIHLWQNPVAKRGR